MTNHFINKGFNIKVIFYTPPLLFEQRSPALSTHNMHPNICTKSSHNVKFTSLRNKLQDNIHVMLIKRNPNNKQETYYVLVTRGESSKTLNCCKKLQNTLCFEPLNQNPTSFGN